MKLYTVKAVADWLDLTETRVRQLRKEKIITEYRPGLFDLKTVCHEYINYLRKSSTEESALDYNAERARLLKAKRENQEMELKIRKKDLHSTEEIEQAISTALVTFKTRLLAIPAKLSPDLAVRKDKTEIFRVLKTAMDEVLEELSDFDNIFKEDEENGSTHKGNVPEDI